MLFRSYDKNNTIHCGSWVHQAHKPSDVEKIWNTEIANDYYCSYLASKTLNLLYYMCLVKNITCFFVNAFSPIVNLPINLVPEKNWLLSCDKSLADDFFEIREPEPLIGDAGRITKDVWLKHKEKIDIYLIPNDNHPNQLGNDKIAEKLTDIIQQHS